MKTLYESLLSDIDSTLQKGNKNIVEAASLGNYYKLKQICGNDDLLMNINKATIKRVVSDLKPFSKDINNIIEQFISRYCGFQGLSAGKKDNLDMLITFIENVQVDELLTAKNLNDKKLKMTIANAINNKFEETNVISKNVKASTIYESKSSWLQAEATNLFWINLESPRTQLSFLYEIK